MTWTQPLCEACWRRWFSGPPARLAEPEGEVCCLCGQPTTSGVYLRLDPGTVPFPRRESDGPGT